MPTPHSPTSGGSRRGCGATATCSQFVEWLRAHNDAQRHPTTKVRFYGLDLYSLRASIEAVIRYLDAIDPAEARRARARYACFDHVGGEGQAYGYALAHQGRFRARTRSSPSCWRSARHADEYLRRDGWIAEDELFFAEQNAVVVRDAEEYYQQMYRAEVVVVEPPRPAHGGDARRAGRPPRPAARPRQDRRVGAQLARR